MHIPTTTSTKYGKTKTVKNQNQNFFNSILGASSFFSVVTSLLIAARILVSSNLR